MAKRPVFVLDEKGFVETLNVDFKWYPGLSKAQKKRDVISLHEAAAKRGLKNILEVSTKSLTALGQSLSAMNLLLYIDKRNKIPVECAFQGSKVFEHGGPYIDLFDCSNPKTAKRDSRLSTSGKLMGFQFQDINWGLEPKSAFYDWLYLQALQQNKGLADQLLEYDAFTDIEYNPKRSYSTQARACALYVCLKRSGCAIERVIAQQEKFLQTLEVVYH